MAETIGEHLALYESLGFSVIPLSPGVPGDDTSGKRPRLRTGEFIEWAVYQKRHASYGETLAWWPAIQRGLPSCTQFVNNVGIVTGAISGNLAVIDIDDMPTYEHIVAAVPELGQRMTVSTGKGRHIYVRIESGNAIATTTFRFNGNLHHVKAEGGYVVAPPSRHYTGRVYTLQSSELGEPVPVEWLRDSLLSAGVVGVSEPTSESRNPPGWAAQLVMEDTPQGGRQEALIRLAGHLAAVFGPYRADEAEAWLSLWNEARVKPPLSERELEKALRYAMQREERKPRMSNDYTREG